MNGDINNINKKEYPELYDDITMIFKEMLPCMKEIQNINEYQKLNVIVKIQSYELKNEEVYEGEFHQEGFKADSIFMVAKYITLMFLQIWREEIWNWVLKRTNF